MSLENTVANLNKTYGKSALVRLGENFVIEKEMIPTGSFLLDDALSGGLVRGRTIELIGAESSGKTTLALHFITEAQKFGETAFIDVEHAFDMTYAKSIGVDVDKLWFSQPDTAEQAFEIIEGLADSGEVSLIVLDSVAGLAPRAEVEGESGESNMGLLARLMGQHLRKVTSLASKNKTTIVYINQLRYKIGVFFGNPETTPGGNALKYFTSVRMDIRRKEILKTNDKENIGILSRIRIIKNKTAIPFKEADININYGEGIDKYNDLLMWCLAHNIIEKKGSWYSYENTNIGQGLNGALIYVKENFEALKQKVKEIKETL